MAILQTFFVMLYLYFIRLDIELGGLTLVLRLESVSLAIAGGIGVWAWGVAAEVILFLRMHRLLQRFGARGVLLASLGLAVLRWLLIGNFVDSLAVQIFAQTLHAATFGAFHAAAIHLVHHYFSGRQN